MIEHCASDENELNAEFLSEAIEQSKPRHPASWSKGRIAMMQLPEDTSVW